MDIIGTTLSVAQTLADALQCYELVEKLSVFGYEDELDDLQRTVGALTAVLRDAETKQELSHQAQVYIEELKKAFFEADDLVDEFVTLAQQQRLVDADGSLRENKVWRKDAKKIHLGKTGPTFYTSPTLNYVLLRLNAKILLLRSSCSHQSPILAAAGF